MATITSYMEHAEGFQVSLPVPDGTEIGDPLVVGGVPVVALEDEGNITDLYSTCRRVGAYNLSVKAVDDSGNTAVAVGDDLYFNSADTPVLSRKKSGEYFGKAIEAITTVGGTSTITVWIGVAGSEPGEVSRGTYCEFETNPVTGALGGGVASTTAVNIMIIDGLGFEYDPLGTQTITSPQITADGLNVGLDQAANDGVEITRGITARNPESFVVGTDPAFYAKCRFTIPDVSGTDVCLFGFRKAEAYQADFNNYADQAALSAKSGDITLTTIVGGAATVETDTTDDWADTEEHEFEVNVSAAGVVTYKIDGAAPTTVAAYTFTDGLRVMPFFHYLHDTDIAGAIIISKWESGLL